MYELRKLKHQHRPVSEFGNKQQLERFLTQRNQLPLNSEGANDQVAAPSDGEPESLVAQQARRFANEPQAADPQSLMPEGIRLEVRGLYESQRVSQVLRDPALQEQFESALRQEMSRHQRRQQRRTGRSSRSQAQAQPEQDIRGGGRGDLLAAIRRGRSRGGGRRQASARSPAHQRRRAPPGAPNRQYPPRPRRDQSGIVEQVRQSPTLNSLNPEERDRVVAEIGHLVQQQFVTTALTGEFRGVLELHIQV